MLQKLNSAFLCCPAHEQRIHFHFASDKSDVALFIKIIMGLQKADLRKLRYWLILTEDCDVF